MRIDHYLYQFANIFPQALLFIQRHACASQVYIIIPKHVSIDISFSHARESLLHYCIILPRDKFSEVGASYTSTYDQRRYIDIHQRGNFSRILSLIAWGTHFQNCHLINKTTNILWNCSSTESNQAAATWSLFGEWHVVMTKMHYCSSPAL